MKNFAAIDFETANAQRCSVCSVGVIVVRNGVICDSLYRLIRPRPNFYSDWNTAVHGLTYEDTQKADEFPMVWQEVEFYIKDLPLVAHNSAFDEGCLRAAFETFRMNYPNYKFFCTYQASRRAFRDELPNHKLDTVAARCGFDLKNHHNALADAEACAAIAMKIL